MRGARFLFGKGQSKKAMEPAKALIMFSPPPPPIAVRLVRNGWRLAVLGAERLFRTFRTRKGTEMAYTKVLGLAARHEAPLRADNATYPHTPTKRVDPGRRVPGDGIEHHAVAPDRR